MTRFVLCLLALPFLLTNCKPKPLDGGEEIAKEAESRKIKRITPEQIFSEAYLAGDSITRLATRLRVSTIKEALATEGVAGAMKYCHARYPELDSVLAYYGATLQRTSQKLRNPANKATGQIAELLDAYHYNTENNLPLEPNVQQTETEDLIYTKAIVISDQACLKCHGEPGKDITPSDAALLAAAYPSDQATGYKSGDLRGMWQVNLSREGLAKSLAEKSQKNRRKRN